MKHQAADALSDLSTSGGDETPPEDELAVLEMDTSDNKNPTFYIINTQSDDIIPLTAKEAKLVKSPPTENKFIVKQASGTYCKAASLKIGHSNSEFYVNHHRRIICKSTVDQATQIVMPRLTAQPIKYVAHHPPITKHLGKRRMYITLR